MATAHSPKRTTPNASAGSVSVRRDQEGPMRARLRRIERAIGEIVNPARKRRRLAAEARKHRSKYRSPDSHEPDVKAPVLGLCDQLFSGFESIAVDQLEAIAHDPAAERYHRSCAAWALARWRAMARDPQEALAYVRIMRDAAPEDAGLVAPSLLETNLLIDCGETDLALDAALAADKRWPKRTEIELMVANVHAARLDYEDQLAWFNRSYARHDFVPIKVRPDGDRPTLAGIATKKARPVDCSAGRLSVLMPVHNAAGTVRIALDSLLAQTWTDIEIIVVDDASTDDTLKIVRKLARRDSRIKPLRHTQNRGTYCARNTALAAATGKFVTVHDGDDWSHPQKFATQIAALLKNDHLANMSSAAAVDDALRVVRRPINNLMVYSNQSSLVIRRAQLLEIGAWDEVRVSADSELIARLRMRFGQKPAYVLTATPLSLLSTPAESLTRHASTGLQSLRYGLRREYHEAYLHWHAREAEREEPNFRLPREPRAFPIPGMLLPGPAKTPEFDVLTVADLSEPDTATTALWAEAAGKGLIVGALHLPKPANIALSVADHVRDELAAGAATPVVAGEITANPSLACEIVRAAIQTTDADTPLVIQIVESAILAAPESMRLIAQCAIASAPEALPAVQGLLAKLDPHGGDAGSSSKSAKSVIGNRVSNPPVIATPNPLDRPRVLPMPPPPIIPPLVSGVDP